MKENKSRKEYYRKNKEIMNERVRVYRAKMKEERDMSVFYNHRKPWTTKELRYLSEWYDKLGAINLSYELGRTPETIRTKMQVILNSN